MRKPTTLTFDQATDFFLSAPRALSHVSASSIQSFQDCESKWFSRYVSREREPGTTATELGSEIHDFLEAYILTGVLPDQENPAGVLASLALPYIPEPLLENVGAELDLDQLPLQEPCAVPFKGFIDLLDTRDEENIVLTDYKTSSNVKKYGKSPDELRTNTQMVIYAKHVFDNYPEASTLTIRHIYLQTKGSSICKEVSVEVSRSEVDEQFVAIRGIVSDMVEASKKKVSELKKNTSFCFAFGQLCNQKSACDNPNREVPRSKTIETLIKSLNTEVE